MGRSARWVRGVGAVLLVVVSTSVGRADETTAELFDQADAAFAANDLLGAAAKLGDAAAHAHEKGLLREENATLERLRVLVSRVPAGGSTPTSTRPVSRNDLIVAALQRLDPTRAGAHVSAHALSMLILIDGATTGTPSLVGFADDALARFARARHTGAGAQMLADWARGLLVVERHLAQSARLEDAVGPLQSALDACVRHGWREPAIYVGTELAVAWLEMEQPAAAKAALHTVAELVSADTDLGTLQLWRTLVGRRLPRASADVLAPFTEAMAPHESDVRVPGGRGGRGGKGGVAQPPDFIRAFDKARSRKRLVVVKRTQAGFRATFAHDGKLEQTVRSTRLEEVVGCPGVAITVWHHAVGLAYVDRSGKQGEPPRGSRRTAWRAWYYLARGEAWALTKGGRIVVSR